VSERKSSDWEGVEGKEKDEKQTQYRKVGANNAFLTHLEREGGREGGREDVPGGRV